MPEPFSICVLGFFGYNMQLIIFAHSLVLLPLLLEFVDTLHIMDISFLSYIYIAIIILICISTLLTSLRYF